MRRRETLMGLIDYLLEKALKAPPEQLYRHDVSFAK